MSWIQGWTATYQIKENRQEKSSLRYALRAGLLLLLSIAPMQHSIADQIDTNFISFDPALPAKNRKQEMSRNSHSIPLLDYPYCYSRAALSSSYFATKVFIDYITDSEMAEIAYLFTLPASFLTGLSIGIPLGIRNHRKAIKSETMRPVKVQIGGTFTFSILHGRYDSPEISRLYVEPANRILGMNRFMFSNGSIRYTSTTVDTSSLGNENRCYLSKHLTLGAERFFLENKFMTLYAGAQIGYARTVIYSFEPIGTEKHFITDIYTGLELHFFHYLRGFIELGIEPLGPAVYRKDIPSGQMFHIRIGAGL